MTEPIAGKNLATTGELDDAVKIMLLAHECLKRWAARYASSDHAKKHVTETRELMTDIEKWTYERAS